MWIILIKVTPNVMNDCNQGQHGMQKMQPAVLKGVLIYLAANLAMAVLGAFAKLITEVGTGTIVFFQYAIALLLSLPPVLKGGVSSFRTAHIFRHLIRDIVGVLTFTFLFLALSYMPLTNAIVLRSCAPFWIPLILLIWYKERISPALWIYIILGFIGVLFITHPKFASYNLLGSFYGLASGIALAISVLIIRWVATTEPAGRTVFYYFFIGTLSGVLFSAPQAWHLLSYTSWLLLLGIGVLMYLVQHGFIIAFACAKARTLAPISYSPIAFSVGLDALIWHKYPNIGESIGIFLIIYAGVMSTLLERPTN